MDNKSGSDSSKFWYCCILRLSVVEVSLFDYLEDSPTAAMAYDSRMEV